MHLQTAVLNYLNHLPDDSGRTYFFRSQSPNCSLIGSVRGQLVCILIIQTDRKMTRSEIEFSARIYQSGGEHYTVRSMHDICEISKSRGWL